MRPTPHRLACLARAGRGAAAVEFACLLPIMVTLLLATFEFVNALRIQGKLNLAAGQFAQMIAAQPSVTEGSAEGPGGTLGDLCTAASYDLYPYGTSTLSAWVESTTVTQPFGLQTSQDWANDTSCPAAQKSGSVTETIALTNIADTPRSLFTIDGTPKQSGGQLVKGYSAISVQLTYAYKNVLPYLLNKTLTFTAVAAARPRSNTTISCTYPSGGGSASCPNIY